MLELQFSQTHTEFRKKIEKREGCILPFVPAYSPSHFIFYPTVCSFQKNLRIERKKTIWLA